MLAHVHLESSMNLVNAVLGPGLLHLVRISVISLLVGSALSSPLNVSNMHAVTGYHAAGPQRSYEEIKYPVFVNNV